MDYISQFEVLKSKELSLDLTRGKPSEEQLDLSNSLINFDEKDFSSHGIDIRNYGEVKGLEACRKIGSEILGCSEDYIWSGGNSSLSLMSKFLSFLFIQGNKSGPWNNKERVSVLCPVPGYDRHFKLLENFGIEMVTVPFQDDGPDLNAVEHLLKSEENIHGIVCVPRHSNPTGHTYSDENVKALFKLTQPYKNNFSFFWDNAYACHDLDETIEQTPINKIAKDHAMEDNYFQVGSTSKVTLAGAGISFLSSSETNLNAFIDFRNAITPGPNKMNQGLHVKYFEAISLDSQMKELKKVIKPKFELVDSHLEPLQSDGLCTYVKPTGGYFFSFNSTRNNADEIIQCCSKLGLKLLPVGSCFPYEKDPENSNIRLAPTFPDIATLERCIKIFINVAKYLN